MLKNFALKPYSIFVLNMIFAFIFGIVGGVFNINHWAMYSFLILLGIFNFLVEIICEVRLEEQKKTLGIK